MRILCGTKNRGKLPEVRRILSDVSGIQLISDREQPFDGVPETGRTFRENALLKARGIARQTGLTVLAEDSGLEVAALGGEPGVRSARFAGEHACDEQNIELLLRRLTGVEHRAARFVCVAALRFPDGTEHVAEGELQGRIAGEPRGTYGFGYDPVFIPEGFDRTLAELGPDVKSGISHRRNALQKIKEKLRKL